MFSRHWLVCDMDGTLTSTPTKAGGTYLDLTHSPCCEPLRRYMANGGNLCVVSTAGRRMWRQTHDQLKDIIYSTAAKSGGAAATKGGSVRSKAGRLAICGFSGAALFLSDAAKGAMVEVEAYRKTALKYNSAALYGKIAEERASSSLTKDATPSVVAAATSAASSSLAGHHFTEATTIDEFNQEAIVDIAVSRVRAFINAAADELLASSSSLSGSPATATNYVTPLVKILSGKYHVPYMALAAERNAYLAANNFFTTSTSTASPKSVDGETEQRKAALVAAFNESVLSKKRLMTHGSVIEVTKDALVDLQYVPDTAVPNSVGIQVTVMGIPMALYDQFFTAEIVAELASYGVSAKKQPNSVAINKKGIDKALCVQWMRDHVEGFSLEHSLAFGDIPSSVDKPLAQFPPMQFVSLSMTPSTDPTDTKTPLVFVGEEEIGTAYFLEAMLDEVLAGGAKEGSIASSDGVEAEEDMSADAKATRNHFTKENVGRWAEAARKAMALKKSAGSSL